MNALTLQDVMVATGGRIVSGVRSLAVSGVSIDSRTLGPGELFVAIVGPRNDGHDFLGDASQRAAAALISEDVVAPPGLGLVRVADTTQALAALARYVRRN